MISGIVVDGVPLVRLEVGNSEWPAIVDTGFNGELELPEVLATVVNPQFFGSGTALLAGGQSVEEDHCFVDFPFDGLTVRALATFVPGDETLIGTALLAEYELKVDFPRSHMVLRRSDETTP